MEGVACNPCDTRQRVTKKTCFVVNNDTLVENPIISDYIIEVLDCIKTAAVKQDLPITVQITTPKLEDSFWISF